MPTHRRLRYRGRRKARYRCGWVTLHRTGFAPVGRQTKFHDITASSLPFDQPCLVALCTNADRNQSAARSLTEGFDETLTLHRLGLYGVLGRSLKTTNCLESINALVEERCAKVDRWQNSSQRHRWLATALVDVEPRLRKVMGYRHLPKLRDALQRELKIDTTTSKKEAA